ncbi:MAG: UTRA domain-containing protein [Atopobiaceae bacterium]
MPKAMFEGIYLDLKEKIKNGTYKYQTYLPSENGLVGIYSCSRNTVRRALHMLADEGYVQPLHGKGVRVIWRETARDIIGSLDGLQSFGEYAARNHMTPSTTVREFEHLTCGKGMAEYTGFAEGEELIRIVRIRRLDDFPCQIDRDYLLAKAVPGLTPTIAEDSIYRYLEQKLGMRILTSKRQMTVELANDDDNAYLRLGPYNCVAVVESQSFNSDGVMFEFTQVRSHPDTFRYCTVSRR